MDVSRSAWSISFNDAIDSALNVQIDGVDVRYVDLKTLIATKETSSERDRADIVALKRLLAEATGLKEEEPVVKSLKSSNGCNGDVSPRAFGVAFTSSPEA